MRGHVGAGRKCYGLYCTVSSVSERVRLILRPALFCVRAMRPRPCALHGPRSPRASSRQTGSRSGCTTAYTRQQRAGDERLSTNLGSSQACQAGFQACRTCASQLHTLPAFTLSPCQPALLHSANFVQRSRPAADDTLDVHGHCFFLLDTCV
jgi:hypothetical protein